MTGIAFAETIPEGPPFAISGAEKPKDGPPSTATAVPMVIRLDGDNSHTLNPAVITAAIRLVVSQYLGAEGQEITAPGATEPAKAPDLARAPARWNLKSILANLAGLLTPPTIRATGGAAFRAVSESRPARQQNASPATGSIPTSPIKIVLTSLGRSSGDAFQMTVLNEGRAPVS